MIITPPIAIREATSDDVPFMKAMLWEALLASPNLLELLGVAKIQQEEDIYWDKWATNPDPGFIALDANGQQLGAIIVKPNEATVTPGWRIGIGLKAEACGQRIGQLLIERVFQFACEENAHYVNLRVASDNLRAIKLYQRCGFIEAGQKDGIIEMRINL